MQAGGSRGSWQRPWKSGSVPWQQNRLTKQPKLLKGNITMVLRMCHLVFLAHACLNK